MFDNIKLISLIYLHMYAVINPDPDNIISDTISIIASIVTGDLILTITCHANVTKQDVGLGKSYTERPTELDT